VSKYTVGTFALFRGAVWEIIELVDHPVDPETVTAGFVLSYRLGPRKKTAPKTGYTFVDAPSMFTPLTEMEVLAWAAHFGPNPHE
jgi:hypothetical protein